MSKRLKTHLKFEFYKSLPRTKSYKVYSNHDKSELGVIHWEKGWRQYVYNTDYNKVVWSWECLEELKNFIIKLNKEQKRK